MRWYRLLHYLQISWGKATEAEVAGLVGWMYCLQAVIATEPVLRELAGSTTEACIVPLSQHLWLLPMTDALFDAVTVAGAPELDRFWKAPAALIAS